MDHSYFLPLVEQYIRPQLGGRIANQFVRAIERPSDEFSERFLWRHLSNICISETVYDWGRTHQLAHEIRNQGKAEWLSYRQQVTYWTNTMVLATPLTDAQGEVLTDDKGRTRWDQPSQRVVGGFPYVFTVEFDIPEIEFVKTQMSWCRSSGKPLDAPLGGLYGELSRFGDFMGITACWSGNKSLHLHIMFDSYPIVDRAGLDRRAMRDGFTAHWGRVVEIIKAVLEIPPGIDPDKMLDRPESFRRMPWGTRIIGKDAKDGIPKPNILGMPVGTKVPQVTLWEQYRGHRAADADELFFQPAPFLRTAERDRKLGVGVEPGGRASEAARGNSNPPTTAIRPGPLAEDERVYCESRLRQHCERKWGAWPKLYRLEWNGSNWIASFYNSQHDGRASSIIRDDFAHLMMCGRDAWKDRSPPPLDFRLGVLMALWLKERRTSHTLNLPEVEPDPNDLVTWIDRVRSRPLSEVELSFQAAATGPDKVPDLTRRAVLKTVRDNPLSYLKGPEGAGKTKGLIAEFDQIVRAAGGQEKLQMMAFGNYDAAAEKAREFNTSQNRNGYHSVVVASWIREYRDICQKSRVDPLTLDDALSDGYSSLWVMVCDRQPRIIKALERRHQEVWKEVGRRRPVFMTSHALMQNWTKYSHSRAFWHRDFWLVHKGGAEPDRMAALRTDMQLGVAVHDEVAAGDLLDIHRLEAIEWVRDLKRDYPSWRRPGETLEKSQGLIEALAVRGKPSGVYHGREIDLDFQTCRLIADGSDKAWREVVVQDSGEYGETTGRGELESIYQRSVGNRWMVRPRNWWAGLARRVVILTTELVPTVIAGCLPPVKVLGRGRDDRQVFRIVELECPLIPRDTVRLRFDRGCTAKGVREAINRFRSQHGDDFMVISDKARESSRTMTHARAKGSNGLIGQDLAQTMLHMGPEEHEIHEVLNAWAGVGTCVKFRHVDAFNQTAGRNLGFRKRGVDPHHWLILSVSLWSKIDEVLCRESRYDFALWLSQNERREIRRRQAEAEFQQAEAELTLAETGLNEMEARAGSDSGEVLTSRRLTFAEMEDMISALLSRTSNSNLLNKEAIQVGENPPSLCFP